jgi:serine/threonine protein kinase
MSESPRRPIDRSKVDASRAANPATPSKETNRVADSVPTIGNPFPLLPTQFGRYRIEKKLGKGAMGAVYLAYDIQLDRHIALKVAKISTTGSTKLIKRMEAEAKLAAKVDHPLICKVYDFGEIDGIRFIAQQYIEGETFKSFLNQSSRRQKPAEARQWILQLANALEAAHDRGVIHRDLKPENVMVNLKGEPVIMDFGLARNATGATDAGLTQGMVLGTAAYMSPEQALGKAAEIDHRSDLYALGVMLFEMLTGKLPFTGIAIEVIGKKTVLEPPSLVELNPQVPPRLAAVCQKLIARNKEDRYASCAELITALEAADINDATPIQSSFEGPGPGSIHVDSSTSVFDFLMKTTTTAPSYFFTSLGTTHGLSRLSNLRRRIRRHWIQWSLVCGVSLLLIVFAASLNRTNVAVVGVDIQTVNTEVTIRNEQRTLANGMHELKLKPGANQLHIKSEQIEFDTADFTLKARDKTRILVTRESADLVARVGEREIGRHRLGATAPVESERPARKRNSTVLPPAPGGWVDLLELAEGVDWAPRGIRWNDRLERPPTRSGIILKPIQFNRFPLPVTIDGDYEMEVEFTRQDGNDAVLVVFPVGIHNMHLELGAANGLSGVRWIDGLSEESNPTRRPARMLNNNQVHRVRIRVRSDGDLAEFNVEMDGIRDFINWKGNTSSLTNLSDVARTLSMIRHVWVGNISNRTTFHKVRVQMLSGEIRRDTITDADREEDLSEGMIRLVGQKPDSSKTGWASMTVNQYPIALNGSPTELVWPLVSNNFRMSSDYYGAHAPSRLTSPIPEGAKSFSVVGYNCYSGSTKYLVSADGVPLHETGVTAIALIKVDLPIGARQLELVVDPSGYNFQDHSYWCYPRFHSVSMRQITDKMLDADAGLQKFSIGSANVGYAELTHNESIRDPHVNSAPIHFRDARPCDEFLFAHAPSSIVYDVPDGFGRFTAIGYNVRSRHVSFEVLAEGKQVYKSPQTGVVAIDVKLPAGTSAIQLKIKVCGATHGCIERLNSIRVRMLNCNSRSFGVEE